ncbi:MAG: type II toxin-antitoxin system RelE/ParE family toxin [Rhodospirillales bacterium]|nr:type II toxin-antitoxin system RelE/ParE family toxin [Rhodospirillales bacterium]
MIRSFADQDTERLFNRQSVRRYRASERQALIKLRYLDAATMLHDLASPPGNRLEALRGDRQGSCSIRVNRQRRVCFRWHENEAWDVEIVDYHD